MPKINVTIPLYMPQPIYRLWRKLREQNYLSLKKKTVIPNLVGDRDIEWSWIVAQIPHGDGEALDFGNGGSALALVAALRGFQATAIDFQNVEWPYSHPRLQFVQGDILKLTLGEDRFDLIINSSAIEHVGLSGRYDITEAQEDGDLMAMAILRRLLKPNGLMLMTIPVGKDLVAYPLHRIYGNQRLPLLLNGFIVENQIYWTKNPNDAANMWIQCDKDEALKIIPNVDNVNLQNNFYGLGCFMLRRNL